MNIPLLIRKFRCLAVSSPRSFAFELSTPIQSSCRKCTVSTTVNYFDNNRWKSEGRRVLIQSMPLKDMGTQGGKQLDVDLISASKENVYPDADTPNTLYDGVKFSDLPICYIRTSKNNTILNFRDASGTHIVYRSCGMDGFKNTRKGTNIAAQTTAVAIGGIAREKGITNVRVLIQGLGPGRMSAVKGLQMAGLHIVCVADRTPISFTPPRPRKARRL